MTYKRYEKYKSSGIEWIGEIPKDWAVCRIKQYCTVKDGTHDTPKYVDESDETYPLITSKDIKNNEITFNEAKYISKEDYLAINKRSDVKKNDIIMPMIGTVGNPAIVNTDREFSIKNVALFKTNQDIYRAKYLKYVLDSQIIKEQFNILNRGGVQNFVSLSVLNNLYITNPISDIKNIVDFLDKKTTELDSLMQDKEKLIELLKEQRQAIITEAVTKGLDKNVKMKDSGIEWIGDIPDRWNVSKIKFSTYVKGRIGWQGLKSDEFIDEGPYLVTGTDFDKGIVNWDNCYHISDERYNEAPPIQLKENDLLITKDGTIGKIAMVKNKPDKAILNSGIFVTRCLNKEYITEYMFWVLNSNVFERYIKFMETGSTIKHLYQETFVNFSYPLPKLEEQIKIVGFLEEKSNEIDDLIKEVEMGINNLKEYKKSLITEAVTGKIDVRNIG